MKRQTPPILIALSLLIWTSCTPNEEEKIDTLEPDKAVNNAPVETNPANTSYRAAFVGQTRIQAVKTESPAQFSIISTALSSPWGIVGLPDGRLLITQKAGTFRIVTPTGTVSAPITGIPPVNAAGQGGLLGLCLSPTFTTDRLVYWVFAENVPNGSVTSVGKGTLAVDERTIENPTLIYRAFPASTDAAHYGGRIVFDANGYLVLSTGDRNGLSTRQLAQSASTGLGKIIRITTTGQPAPNNPAFQSAGALPELYSMGHRNPQGLALHPETQEIWQSEHGPRGGDEINRVRGGANYGWPTITYGIEYGGQAIGGGLTQQTGMEQPVYYWDPVISPSGMTFYRGNRIPEWQNNLFVCALSGRHIARLVIENNRVMGEERLLVGESQRFRDITQGQDGALYAITDSGRLYKVDRR